MKRPTIKDHFAEKATLTQVHHEYTQSPHLYSYASELDRYVDWLKGRLSERENEIETLNKQLLEKSLPIHGVTGSISLADITQAFLDWLQSDDVWINDENGNRLPNAEIDGGNFEKYAKKYYQ